MKKMLMVLISIALIFCMAGAGSAAELNETAENNDGIYSSETLLELNESILEEGFTITIPDTIPFVYNESLKLHDANAYVNLTKVMYKNFTNITVDLTSSNKFCLVYKVVGEGSIYAPYTLTTKDIKVLEGSEYVTKEELYKYYNPRDLTITGKPSDSPGDTLYGILVYSGLNELDSICLPNYYTNLYFKLVNSISVPATYTDTLTFTVTVEDTGYNLVNSP